MPTEDTKLKPQSKQTVSVDKDTLEGLIKRLDDQSRDIKMLREVADKSRISNWEKKNVTIGARTAKLSTYKGKLVMAWRTIQDEVYADAQGRWHEKQTTEIITEDNEKIQLEYVHFAKLVKIEAEIVSRYTTPEGQDMIRLNLDGRVIDIDIKFVN